VTRVRWPGCALRSRLAVEESRILKAGIGAQERCLKFVNCLCRGYLMVGSIGISLSLLLSPNFKSNNESEILVVTHC
jgi:hypothetical protein